MSSTTRTVTPSLRPLVPSTQTFDSSDEPSSPTETVTLAPSPTPRSTITPQVITPSVTPPPAAKPTAVSNAATSSEPQAGAPRGNGGLITGLIIGALILITALSLIIRRFKEKARTRRLIQQNFNAGQMAARDVEKVRLGFRPSVASSNSSFPPPDTMGSRDLEKQQLAYRPSIASQRSDGSVFTASMMGSRDQWQAYGRSQGSIGSAYPQSMVGSRDPAGQGISYPNSAYQSNINSRYRQGSINQGNTKMPSPQKTSPVNTYMTDYY